MVRTSLLLVIAALWLGCGTPVAPDVARADTPVSLGDAVNATTTLRALRAARFGYESADAYFDAIADIVRNASRTEPTLTLARDYADLERIWRDGANNQTPGTPAWRESMGMVAHFRFLVLEQVGEYIEAR